MINRKLHFDYTASKVLCESLGLIWLGDDWVRDADEDAWAEGFTQAQVDLAMRHTLLHIKNLFTPEFYTWWQRAGLALHFLTGWTPQ